AFQNSIFYAFAFVSALYVTHLGLYLMAANFYDIWLHKHKRQRLQPAYRFTGPGSKATAAEPPLVSVIISAHNEQPVIVRTLDSLRRSSYPNVEFLIADDASKDCTKQLVRDYMLRYPDMNLRVYRMHKNVGKGGALNTLL